MVILKAKFSSIPFDISKLIEILYESYLKYSKLTLEEPKYEMIYFFFLQRRDCLDP